MRKGIILLLAAALLVSMGACALGEKDYRAVHFYYLRETDAYLYGSADGVVTFEERDPTGHVGDFRYLLMLYLQGPLDETLVSPFPQGCAVTELERRSTEMTVTLNAQITALRGMDRTLACVCLARTCFSMANVQSVRILAESADGEEAINEMITIDSLLLEDNTRPSQAGK